MEYIADYYVNLSKKNFKAYHWSMQCPQKNSTANITRNWHSQEAPTRVSVTMTLTCLFALMKRGKISCHKCYIKFKSPAFDIAVVMTIILLNVGQGHMEFFLVTTVADQGFLYLGQENPTRKAVLGNLILHWLSGTVDCWHYVIIYDVTTYTTTLPAKSPLLPYCVEIIVINFNNFISKCIIL